MAKNCQCKLFLTIFPKKTGIIQNGQKYQFFLTIFPKKICRNLEWPKMAIPNFSDNISWKDWYKFRMAKNGHSKFFLTIFSQKTGINLEWPKMAVPNFSDNFSQKDWYQFRMAKNGIIPNFFKQFFQKRFV